MMNFMTEIRNELLKDVIVMVDDYETGEVLFEGKLDPSERHYTFLADELDRDGIEFGATYFTERRDGSKVAAISVVLTAEQKEALIEYDKAHHEYIAWINEPVKPNDSTEPLGAIEARLAATDEKAWRRWYRATK